jgi:predicted nucleic acid-binding protein
MSAIVSFDSNVLIYAIDNRGGELHRTAAAVLGHAIRSGRALLPLQALGEFYHVTTRKFRIDRPTARRFIDGWRRTARIEPYGEADIEAAMNACETHGLSFWDAMIWAVSDRAGASLLVSEDMQAGRRLGNVTLVSPFDPATHRLLGLA